MSKTVSNVGEEGALKIIERYAMHKSSNVPMGFGDDAAVVKTMPGHQLVCTTDMLVEGTHFRIGHTRWKDLGRKSILVNLSDLAAMGASPLVALVSLGVPSTTPLSTIEQLYKGFKEECDRSTCALVGGDTVRATKIVISVSLAGTIPDNIQPPYRSKVKNGMNIYVTGTLGDSKAGCEFAYSRNPPAVSSKVQRFLLTRHRLPIPRLKEGITLTRAFKDLAMIDLSDGLLSDLAKMCETSGVGCRITVDTLPVSSQLAAYCERRRKDSHEYAIIGGEDYELLFATRASEKRVRDALNMAHCTTSVTRIGKAEGDKVRFVDKEKNDIVIHAASYQHFG